MLAFLHAFLDLIIFHLFTIASILLFQPGGGFEVTGGTLTLTTCEIYNNEGGFVVEGGTLTLTTCKIYDNTAGVSSSPAHFSAPLKCAIFGTFT